MSSYTNSPDLFKIPSPSSTPMTRKLGGADDGSPEFPALDPATRDLIARTSKLLGATHRDTDSPVLSAIPDSPFSTPLIKAATSRTRYGLPSVSRVVAVSASKSKATNFKVANEDLSQSPDFNLEAPAPAPSYVSTAFLQNLKLSSTHTMQPTAPMRDSTNTAAPPQSVTSVHNLVSLILGKKGGSASEAGISTASSASAGNFLSDIPSPPKLSSTFDQENEWESNQTIDRDRSPEIERTIRVRPSLGRRDEAAPEPTSIDQMPSPMKFGGEGSFEDEGDADQFDQTISEAVEATAAQPTMTFKLSRATLPDDFDDVNESIAERTITKLNPKWLPPAPSAIPAAAGSRPQLIQIQPVIRSNSLNNMVKASVPEKTNEAQEVKQEEEDVASVEEQPVAVSEPSPSAESTEIVSTDDAGVNASRDSRSSVTEDTETSQESDESTSEEDGKNSESEFASMDADIASRNVKAALLDREMPLQEAIYFVLTFSTPSMPQHFKSVAAIFSTSQLRRVVGNISDEDIVSACRHMMRCNRIEQLTFPQNPELHWRAILSAQ